MRKEQIQQYTRPAHILLKMLADRRYYERKYAALGYQAIDVLEHEASDDRFRIKVRFQAEPKLPLPGIARKFVSGLQTVVQEDRWDLSTSTGLLLIDLHGLPIKVSADMSLRDKPKGAVNLLNWDIRCAIPLIGAKLEAVMLAEVQARVDSDLEASHGLIVHY